MNAITSLKTVNDDFQVEYEVLSPINISAITDSNRREISLALQNRILQHESKDPYFSYLIEVANLWFKSTQRRIVLHDPLVLYSVYNKDIFKFNDYHVCVEEEGKLTTGLTVPLEELLWVQFAYVDKNDYSLTRCATKVSSKIFIDDFVRQLGF